MMGSTTLIDDIYQLGVLLVLLHHGDVGQIVDAVLLLGLILKDHVADAALRDGVLPAARISGIGTSSLKLSGFLGSIST